MSPQRAPRMPDAARGGTRWGLESGLAALILALLWACGQVFRDRNPVTAFLFYWPSPAIVVLAGLGGWRSLSAGRPALGLGNLAMAGLALAATLSENPRLVAPPPAQRGRPPAQFVAVHWNVCRGCLGWAPVVEELRRQAADLLLLSEMPKKVEVRQLAQELSAGSEIGYQGRRMGTLAVLARGERLSVLPLVNEYALEVHRVLWTPPSRSRQGLGLSAAEGLGLSAVEGLKILAVDIVSSPRVARDPQLRRVVEWIERERPDLVFGDFNAPRTSLALTHLPAGYRHAYDVAGSGWSATWPSVLALWQIDHSILGPAIEPVRYSFFFSRASDHRGQRLEFSRPLAPSPGAVE